MKLLKWYWMILQWFSYKGTIKWTSSSIRKVHNWKREKSAKVAKRLGVPKENDLNILGLIEVSGTHLNTASILQK